MPWKSKRLNDNSKTQTWRERMPVLSVLIASISPVKPVARGRGPARGTWTRITRRIVGSLVVRFPFHSLFYLVLKQGKDARRGSGGRRHELYYSRYKFPRIELCEQRFPLLSNDHVHGHVAKRVVDYF